MSSVLDKIIKVKLDEIAIAKRKTSLKELEAQLPNAPEVRDFFAAVSKPGKVRLISDHRSSKLS